MGAPHHPRMMPISTLSLHSAASSPHKLPPPPLHSSRAEQMVKAAVDGGDQQVVADARRIGQYGQEEAVVPSAQVRASLSPFTGGARVYGAVSMCRAWWGGAQLTPALTLPAHFSALLLLEKCRLLRRPRASPAASSARASPAVLLSCTR